MASPQTETDAATEASSVEQALQQQEMHPMSRSKLTRAVGEPQGVAPAANFSEAIDRIGLGPFQTRIVIMCGMVRALLDVAMFCTACIAHRQCPGRPLCRRLRCNSDFWYSKTRSIYLYDMIQAVESGSLRQSV